MPYKKYRQFAPSGTAAQTATRSVRRCGRRYRSIRVVAILLGIFSSNFGFACTCVDGCLGSNEDLVARIEILESDPVYLGAFRAKVLDVNHFKTAAILDLDNGTATPRERPSEYITVSDVGVVHREESNRNEFLLSSCAIGFKPGKKYYFFGTYIQSDFYGSSQCSCTIELE